jgi:TPR repeat protein
MRVIVLGLLLDNACGGQPVAHAPTPSSSQQQVALKRAAPSRAFTLIRGSELEASAAGCDGGDQKACVTLALALEYSTERRQAFDLLVRTCDAGELVACAHAGESYLNGGTDEVVAVDRARGIALLERACDGGVHLGCIHLAEDVMAQHNSDRAKARVILDKACGPEDDAGVEACIQFSILLQTKRLGPPDVEAATSILERACTNNVDICAALCNPDHPPASRPSITATAAPIPNVAACKAEQQLRRRPKH